MRAALRLAVVAVPMGVLLSRTMAWMSSGKTHGELINRLRGNGLIMSGLWAFVGSFNTVFNVNYINTPCNVNID